MFVEGDKVRCLQAGLPPGVPITIDLENELDELCFEYSHDSDGLEVGRIYEVLWERTMLGELVIGLTGVPGINRPAAWFALVEESPLEDWWIRALRGQVRTFLDKSHGDVDFLHRVVEESVQSGGC